MHDKTSTILSHRWHIFLHFKINKEVIFRVLNSLILFSIIIMAVNAVEASPPQLPIQVYGDISPDLPQDYPIIFKINGIEYARGIAKENYGYDPVILIPVDDPRTQDKDGYVIGETVDVYINNVLVDHQTYTKTIEKIDITLTPSQINEITGKPTPAIPQTPAPEEKPACIPKWNCTAWGPCTEEGIRTRICYDVRCNLPPRTETKRCVYTQAPTPEEKLQELPKIEMKKVEKRFSTVLIILIIAAVGIGLFVIFYELKRSRERLALEMLSREIPPETMQRLINYVKTARAEGYSDKQIRQILLSEGWSKSIIKKVFIQARRK